MKTVLITGSSGYIATNFINRFSKKYRFICLSHKSVAGHVTFDDLYADHALIASIDIIVNLAGANIGDKRWSYSRKKQLLSSRIDTTQKIVNLFNKSIKKPHLISASAIGIYNEHLNNDESSVIDYSQYENFSQEITKKWEIAALQYKGAITLTRFGVVLGHDGGAFPKMLRPFLWYMGSTLSDGSQYMPWISITDLLNSLDYIISNQYVGVYNVVAPELINNLKLSQAISKVWKKPITFKMPVFIIRLLFGQMGQELFLNSIKVFPKRLNSESFIFKHPTILDACIAIKNEDL